MVKAERIGKGYWCLEAGKESNELSKSGQHHLFKLKYLPCIVASVIHNYLNRYIIIFDFNLDILALDLKTKLSLTRTGKRR